VCVVARLRESLLLLPVAVGLQTGSEVDCGEAAVERDRSHVKLPFCRSKLLFQNANRAKKCVPACLNGYEVSWLWTVSCLVLYVDLFCTPGGASSHCTLLLRRRCRLIALEGRKRNIIPSSRTDSAHVVRHREDFFASSSQLFVSKGRRHATPRRPAAK